LFAAADGIPFASAWEELWSVAKSELSSSDRQICSAVIPLQNWFQKLVEKSAFTCTHNVVVLAWKGGVFASPRDNSTKQIRSMVPGDLPAVEIIDNQAFTLLWRHSQSSLSMALSQAAIATVVSFSGELVGYQISTWTTGGAHLARLAVKPQYQGVGIGYMLLQDLLTRLGQRGVQYVTVNTQHDNLVSLALYKKAGFKPTGETYPVYEEQIGN
jgi:ribosomal protein S18 acetylase RimI-like enzyme